MEKKLDLVWKALADATRRDILDFLRDGPRGTTEIVEQFPHLSRFGVMKHIDVLREAGLIITRAEGRSRVNSINAVPIRQIYERWVSKFEEQRARTLIGLKEDLESLAESNTAKRGVKKKRSPSAKRGPAAKRGSGTKRNKSK